MKLDGDINPIKKALAINLEESIYGTFAEIGAGQEVARYFFQAGLASQTVAKTMSAYDMKFSDEIYGRESSGRYVVQSRLIKMLAHEYRLLKQRLDDTRGKETQFFAYSNTVATSSSPKKRNHGWMGIRFQIEPGGSHNDIILHANFLDTNRLQQQEAIGILGVNLIHAAFYYLDSREDFIAALKENLGPDRVEVDMVCFDGRDLEHFENRLVALELVKQDLTRAIMFDKNGEVAQASDFLYGHPIVAQRGTYRPITKTDLDILNKSLNHIDQVGEKNKPVSLLELTMNTLEKEGEIDTKDFLNRVEQFHLLNLPVLITKFSLFYQLKEYLRSLTPESIYLVIGAGHLEKLFDEKYYTDISGGILESLGRLFDAKSQLLVFPFKTDQMCQLAKTFHPDPHLNYLYRYLFENNKICDILECNDVDTSVHSQTVRDLLSANDQSWEVLVPEKVKNFINKNKLFGKN